MTEATRTLHTNTLAAEPPPESWRGHLAVLLGYLVLGIGFTWPLLLHLPTGVIQKGMLPVDAGQQIWNIWWVRQSLLVGANPYLTHYLFYPEQINLFWQTLSLPNALTVFPVALVAGPVVAFNTLILLSFGLAGYFAYRLARALLADRFAALVAGFVFAFAPYQMPPLLGGTLELIAVHWIPLYILLLMRALHQPTVWRVTAAAAALLLTTLASQYYGLFCLVYTPLHIGLAFLLVRDTGYQLRLIATTGAIPLIWLLALLPFVWPPGSLGTATLEDWYNRQVFHSTALVDFLPFNVNHPLWGELATRWSAALHPFGVEIGASPGLVVYVLLIYGGLRYRREAWPWLILAATLLLFALGPELKIGQTPTGIPLPFRLLDTFGPFQNSSRPNRFIAIMMLPVSVLAGYGVQALRTRWADRQPALAGLIGGVLLVELLVAPWPIMPIQVDPLYGALNGYNEPGAVVELPPRNDDSQYMLNQLCHGRPLAGGYLARTPAYPLVSYDSTLRRLWYGETPSPDIFQVDPANELDRLGIRFVVLNLEHLSGSAAQRLRRQLTAPGIIRYGGSDELEIYRVDAAAPRPVLLPTTGWYPAETDGQQTWRWIGDTARMQVRARSRSLVSLTLTLTGYESPRPLRISRKGVPLLETTVPAAPETTTIRLAFVVPAGVNELQLESDALPAPDGRQLSVSVMRLTFSSDELPDPLLPTLLEPPAAFPTLPWAPCIS